MTNRVLMARQPIFDIRQRVVAYELLYRNEDGINPLPLISGDQASSRVILHSYTSIADAGDLRTLPAFINFSQQMLEADTLPSLSPREIVIEILEDCQPTPSLIAAARRLREAGFRLALDDFSYSEAFDPLLEIADIVKLDIRAQSPAQLQAMIPLLRRFNVTLLAEKVETRDEYELCKSLGCELFQGYFFSKPELLKGHKAAGSKLIMCQLLGLLGQPEVGFEQLNALLSRDPALTYKLLRLTHSAAFGLQHKIASLQDALVYLGLNELKRWASLMILADEHDKPSELMRQILLTARFCELLATEADYADVEPGEAFMAGLLLHLDALLNQDLASLLTQVSVTERIEQALTLRAGQLGQLLDQVHAFVHGDWENTDRALSARMQQHYLDSLSWTRESMLLISSL